MNLPHGFPFRLVDRSSGRARLALTSNAVLGRDGSALGIGLLVEAAAQAAAIELADGPQSAESLRLAALSDVELVRAPSTGSILTFELSPEGRFGGLTRVAALVEDEVGPVARIRLTLAAADPAR